MKLTAGTQEGKFSDLENVTSIAMVQKKKIYPIQIRPQPWLSSHEKA